MKKNYEKERLKMATKIEHPILFNSDMVKAILDGRKTQTRRIAKLPEKWHRGFGAFENNPNGAEEFVIHGDCGIKTIYCPYGTVGDLLWVRETLQMACCEDVESFYYCATGNQLERFPETGEERKWFWKQGVGEKIPSIHMPKWAARIWLKITDIRVERVRDISLEDIQAEGIDLRNDLVFPESVLLRFLKHQIRFKGLWNSINAKRGYGWDVNPWVWAITFEKVNK